MYFVYMLLCSDGSLYTGITTDVERRFIQHKSGVGARYTRSKKAMGIVYSESCGDRGAALKREAAIKKLNRDGKIALVASSHDS